MLKPTKEWVVDGEIFPTYQEACAHIRINKVKIAEKNLTNDLRKILRDAPYGEATELFAEDFAKALLDLYEMKRK